MCVGIIKNDERSWGIQRKVVSQEHGNIARWQASQLVGL